MVSTEALVKKIIFYGFAIEKKPSFAYAGFGGRRWSRGDSNPGPEKINYGSSTCLVILGFSNKARCITTKLYLSCLDLVPASQRYRNQ